MHFPLCMLNTALERLLNCSRGVAIGISMGNVPAHAHSCTSLYLDIDATIDSRVGPSTLLSMTQHS